jgi:HPr kinase/phosphorylase
VICEVVAMNHLLRWSGVDSAQRFNERLLARLRQRRELRELRGYLQDDYE